jgi:hypothetical protein
VIAPRLVERLSHRQRELTPPAFASWLVDQVRQHYGVYELAALFVRRDSPYWAIDGVECYDIEKDAYSYCGRSPIIAHPPCGPWGRYSAVSRQDRRAGLYCLDLVDWVGGVVEQPASSRLFRGGVWLRQGDFGHPAAKETRLYFGNRRYNGQVER